MKSSKKQVPVLNHLQQRKCVATSCRNLRETFWGRHSLENAAAVKKQGDDNFYSPYRRLFRGGCVQASGSVVRC
jgi:hypothetical protein